MGDFDPLRTARRELRTRTATAEEELRTRPTADCGRGTSDFDPTADCGGGTSDFDPLRTAEEELSDFDSLRTPGKEFGPASADGERRDVLTPADIEPKSEFLLDRFLSASKSEVPPPSPQWVEIRSSSSAVRMVEIRKFLFRSPQWVETRNPAIHLATHLASTQAAPFRSWPAMPW